MLPVMELRKIISRKGALVPLILSSCASARRMTRGQEARGGWGLGHPELGIVVIAVPVGSAGVSLGDDVVDVGVHGYVGAGHGERVWTGPWHIL